MWKQLLTVLAVLLLTIRFAFAALDINTASADEFDKLKGIGPVKAKAIVDYRVKNGPFKAIEDIKKVSGIGDAIFQSIKGEIAVGAAHQSKGNDAKQSAESTRKEGAPKPATLAKDNMKLNPDGSTRPESKSGENRERPTEKK